MASIPQRAAALPLLSSETRAQMAKASLRKAEKPHVEMAAVVLAVLVASGLNLDQFAAELKKDARQVKRWTSGDECPQIETVWAVDAFKPLVLEAMARLNSQQVEVETVIRIKRIA